MRFVEITDFSWVFRCSMNSKNTQNQSLSQKDYGRLNHWMLTGAPHSLITIKSNQVITSFHPNEFLACIITSYTELCSSETMMYDITKDLAS